MDEKNKNENGAAENGKRFMRKRRGNLKRTISAVYLGLALCMVVVLAVSFSGTKTAVKDGLDNLEDISVSLPDISLPDISVPDVSVPDNYVPRPPINSTVPDDNPVAGTQSGVADDVVDSESTEVITPRYIWPAKGEVIKGHSLDTLVFSETMQDFRVHQGVDIAAAEGSEVYAYTDGEVISVDNHPLMGKTVKIVHEAGVITVYSNLGEDVLVNADDAVVAGEVIGAVGKTALIEAADNPHLHFEVWMEENCLNPLDQFPEEQN